MVVRNETVGFATGMGAGTTTVSTAPLRRFVFDRTAPDTPEIFDNKLLPVRHTVLRPGHVRIQKKGLRLQGLGPICFQMRILTFAECIFRAEKGSDRQKMGFYDHDGGFKQI